MKLREVGEDDENEVWERVQHFFKRIMKPVHSKRDSQEAKTRIDSEPAV